MNVRFRNRRSPNPRESIPRFVKWTTIIGLVLALLALVLDVPEKLGCKKKTDEKPSGPIYNSTTNNYTYNTHVDSSVHYTYIQRYIASPSASSPDLSSFVSYLRQQEVSDICSDGDFEKGLDTSKWHGSTGYWDMSGMQPSTFRNGLVVGEFSLISDSIDFYAKTRIPQQGAGKFALKIGNDMAGTVTTILSKLVSVQREKSIIEFSYMPVLENPEHEPKDQPTFIVKVFDAETGHEIPDVCDLGNGSNQILPSLLFMKQSSLRPSIYYRNWTRARINLTAYNNRKVAIFFIVRDCGVNGHFGYTYLDNFICL